MPGYQPFLLCDFHVHTRWSDGRLSLREVVDLYGKTRRFDVIAITDHILMERDMFARAGRMMSLGRREFSVTAETVRGVSQRHRDGSAPGAPPLRSARPPRRRDHPESHSQQEEFAHRRAEHPRVHQRRPGHKGEQRTQRAQAAGRTPPLCPLFPLCPRSSTRALSRLTVPAADRTCR
jgi:hypothetical protein